MIINSETDEFGASAPVGNFSLPFDANPYEVKVISYSGSKWTSNVEVYNEIAGSWESIFNLSKYDTDYVKLGDPYVVNLPLSSVVRGNNSVRVFLGLNPSNSSSGSSHYKIIYSVIKNISSFSPISSSANGCIWTIEFEDSTTSTMSIPSDYSGSELCYYNSTISYDHAIFNNNDAIDYAIFILLSTLDLNSNGRVETKFSENDLTINSVEVEGIPFVWETEAQVRVWR